MLPPGAKENEVFPEADELLNPCESAFTYEKIAHAWISVGAVPFTKKCLQDVKVRHGKPGRRPFLCSGPRITVVLVQAPTAALK